MTRLTTQRNTGTKLVEQVIKGKFPAVKAYRYGLGSIRVRIIDPRFARKSLAARERMVEPLLQELPEDVYCDITVLLTLAPGEEKKSPMNYEFEHPSKSGI